ncbi:hypothetical protein, partial [Mesorhizobium sp. LNHC232B00]|uniref:hypothetical protein n=1 Tax=Mesorhizobium sp. LNHC232B00 TaxID=1287243 RepID=UPI001AEC6CE9
MVKPFAYQSHVSVATVGIIAPDSRIQFSQIMPWRLPPSSLIDDAGIRRGLNDRVGHGEAAVRMSRNGSTAFGTAIACSERQAGY